MGNLAARVGPKRRLRREAGSLQQHLLSHTGDVSAADGMIQAVGVRKRPREGGKERKEDSRTDGGFPNVTLGSRRSRLCSRGRSGGRLPTPQKPFLLNPINSRRLSSRRYLIGRT